MALLVLAPTGQAAQRATLPDDVPPLGHAPQNMGRAVDPRHDFDRHAAGSWLQQDLAGRRGLSLADMARLGLVHTVHLGDGRHEQDSTRLRQYLVPISADDCLALLR